MSGMEEYLIKESNALKALIKALDNYLSYVREGEKYELEWDINIYEKRLGEVKEELSTLRKQEKGY